MDMDHTEMPNENENQEIGADQDQKEYKVIQHIKIGVKSGYVLRKVGQAYMVMPTGPRMKDYQGMITLNETGAFLFKESQKEDTNIFKLMEACKAEYGATDEEAKQAVESFIEQCAECGIFERQVIIVDEAEGKLYYKDDITE